MVDLDFSKIRSFDGSQDNGFEELVCQLAHLNKPGNANYFVRKEGAGGDAGVECYWKLLDGSEHAWQAKYFPDRMEDVQWTQITKSVITALEKHPQLTKYYVCLPRDWTDSRKIGKAGKLVHSAWLKWEEHVAEWNLLADSKGMKVEFLYWCKHEISLMLQTDNPYYSGRALYWFNEPVIHPELLRRIALNSRETLGERFTPENHLDLPISNQFDGLGLNLGWYKHIKNNRSLILNQLKKLDVDLFGNRSLQKDEKCWTTLYKELERMENEYLALIEQGADYTQFEKLQSIYSAIEESLEACNSVISDNLEKEAQKDLIKQWREFDTKFYRIQHDLLQIRSFLFGPALQAMTNKAAVLIGEAGIGKSHLLCDIALKRLENNLPTLFLLGQRYSGGNPLNFILDQLDLRGSSYNQVLGALDAAGEARKSRTLIIIDAINEGRYKDEWIDHLSSLLSEISNYPHISIILSCRSTYVDFLLPDISEDRLTRVYHKGFRGFEHRAAMRYLVNQGISKPTVPITSPEFSNPLFLKTFCKALKLNGLSSFPKGVQGQSKLFEFYVDSVGKIVNRKKKYLSGQKIVHNALNDFVQQLYPDNLFGVAITEAIEKIDRYDTNPHLGDNLTTLLIDEGLLSLDIVSDHTNPRGKEIIRFTYERFSDHYIAQYLIDQIDKEDIESHFRDDGSIRKLIDKGPITSGIVEALGIGFPEKLNKEFIDFISEDSIDYEWLFSSSFSEVLQWRAKESFTDRTIELLNLIQGYGFYNEAIDKLLTLSTEPEHPWNADFLDANLKPMNLAERDAFWSTHIAISDREEDDGQAESVCRTLIDWSLFANLNEVETERLRLTAITLLWMTTTSNRKVRDQSTKSLARILSNSPQLISELIMNYSNLNDLYLVERLYSAIYGAVSNIKNENIIRDIALSVYENIFKDGKPIPHILLRDYARGILELAYSKDLLSTEINPDVFRPPYKSDWPIENPSKEEINRIVGDEFSSAIKSSVIGFLGDFGKYTMGCIHDWSPTPLSDSKPESSYEIHLKFAGTLSADLQRRYKSLLDKKMQKSRNEHFDLEEYLDSIKITSKSVEEDAGGNQEIDEWKVLKEEIMNSLEENDKEHFRWVSGLGIDDRPAKFSRKLAQRWVCKRAYELGWEKELFEDFERTYANNHDRSTATIERIGKKYQWIAFHEILARMSDNLFWVDRRYSDIDDSQFWGPWQNHLRDLDPTLWIRETNDSGWDEHKSSWWQPFTFPFVDDNLQQQKSWLWNKEIIPSFEELLERTNPIDNKKWTVLRGFSKWSKKPENDEDNLPSQDAWFRINSIVISKDDIDKVENELKGKSLCDPHISSPNSTGHQRYLKEYPWHPCYQEMNDWVEPDSPNYFNEAVNVKHLVPTNEYEWEASSTDKSLNNSISIYLPNKHLINELDLSLKQDEYGEWIDSKGNLAFIDPSIKELGPSYALIRSDLLNKWLEENNLQLLWLIGGEKQLYTSMANKFYGYLECSGIYTATDKGIDGSMWFVEEPGDNEE